MAVHCIASTDATPAYLVSTTRCGKVVYVNEVFKGYVTAMKTPGFFVARDIDREVVRNPKDADGLWTCEQDALDFLARL